jgi:hypothetical protein
MRLQIVGGHHDGQSVEMKDDQRQITLTYIERVLTIEMRHEHEAVERTVHCHYTVREIWSREAPPVMRWLSPVEWSDEKALKFQFDK